MVYTVTFNPSLDYIVSVNNFQMGMTNRTCAEQMLPGGKGINVSTVLYNLGIETKALGFSAGFTGKEIERRMAEIGFAHDFISLPEGCYRINVKLKDFDGTEINGMGPDISPENVEELMKKLDELTAEESESSVLLNRATQGLYPPGSTFKIVTAMEYMMENPDSYKEYRYRCKGTKVFSGSRINCYSREWHGRLSLPTAFAKSCNGAFADIGTRLDLNAYRKFCEKLYFNQKPSVEFEANKSRFALNAKSDAAEVTQTAIGQGKTLITPLENAMITAMVANGGEMMKPYVVDRVESADGRIVKQYKPKSQGKLVDEWVTEAMTGMMEKVVNEGTGTLLKTSAYQVAGKTGSAEADSDGTTHAWFVGFAPSNHPKLVVSIVVEGAGTGGKYAVPIAKKMFREYLSK